MHICIGRLQNTASQPLHVSASFDFVSQLTFIQWVIQQRKGKVHSKSGLEE